MISHDSAPQSHGSIVDCERLPEVTRAFCEKASSVTAGECAIEWAARGFFRRPIEITRGLHTMRRIDMRYVVSVLIVGLFAGCASTPDRPVPAPRAKSADELQSLGYSRIEAVGVWKYGFERSEFVPNDRPNEKWWLKLPSQWWDENKDSTLRRRGLEQNGASIRASGFLSPKGKYGHLGAYDHEFVAETIEQAASGK